MKLCFNLKKINETNYKVFVNKKNASIVDKFKAVDFKDRFIFIPHCMRNTAVCKAKDEGFFYSCAKCNGCKIGQIVTFAQSLGYEKIYIMKGGRAIQQIIENQKPKAIIGIACYFEGKLGIKLADKYSLPVQFIPLSKDGCANTDVDLDEAKKIIGLKG